MKELRKLDDLKEFGIYPLTGEACRVGTRILCDLTTQGRAIVCDLLGINGTDCFLSNWNHGAGEVSSFMMPEGLFRDLAVWCLAKDGMTDIRIVYPGSSQGTRWEGGVFGIKTEEDADMFSVCYDEDFAKKLGITWRKISLKTDQPGVGTRCTHAMSGQTA